MGTLSSRIVHGSLEFAERPFRTRPARGPRSVSGRWRLPRWSVSTSRMTKIGPFGKSREGSRRDEARHRRTSLAGVPQEFGYPARTSRAAPAS